MKKLRQGQKVKLIDPNRIAYRFRDSHGRGVLGASGIIVPRDELDKIGEVFRLAERYNGKRALIVFGDSQGNHGMWLDADVLEKA